MSNHQNLKVKVVKCCDKSLKNIKSQMYELMVQ